MEPILASALLVSSILHIIFAINRCAERKKRKLIESICPSQNSIPTAEDARFVRKQIRNPSWEKIYKGINKAIQNGEDHFEFHFRSDDPKISISEVKEELEPLGYTINKMYVSLPDDCDFTVRWG